MTKPEFEYFTFEITEDPRLAQIEDFGDDVEQDYELDKGVRMGDRFPPHAVIQLVEDSGDMITDFIANICDAVIISEKVRKIFEEEGLGPELVEYLPFVLKDKRGRTVKKKYCVANALMKVECMDHDRSEYTTYPDGRLQGIDMLHVLKKKIPNDAKFFRLGEDPKLILIRSDLLERLQAEKATGISVLPMGEEFP